MSFNIHEVAEAARSVGLKVLSVQEWTEECDGEIGLEGNRHIQVGGCYLSVVEFKDEAFHFSVLITSIPQLKLELFKTALIANGFDVTNDVELQILFDSGKTADQIADMDHEEIFTLLYR